MVYFGLFLCFVAFMGGTRYLDDYSSHYVNCAGKWEASVKLAEGQVFLADTLLENIDKNQMSFDGKACPKLRYDHALTIRQRLTDQKQSPLRGLNRS